MKKFPWKAFAIATTVIMLVFAVFTAVVKNDKHFKVTHHPKVEQTVDEEGRYVAGSPELYKVDISPSLAYYKAKMYNKFEHKLALVIIVLCAVFIALMQANILDLTPRAAGLILFIGLITSVALWFAAHSSLFTSNWVEIDPATYNLYKDNLEALFEKTIIR